jgi:hypothetical protein
MSLGLQRLFWCEYLSTSVESGVYWASMVDLILVSYDDLTISSN